MKNKNKLFLIVDDEPDMCWALEQILKKNGCLCKKTLNGQNALKLVRQNRFQLAFLDAKLPDIEGLDLARQIREIDPSLRIIIVSGYFYKDDIGVQKALADGFISGFISKPFNHDEIVRNIRT